MALTLRLGWCREAVRESDAAFGARDDEARLPLQLLFQRIFLVAGT